jgi:hypothetical protein
VAASEGKGWAKGRSAKDDPRIARAAAAHRGKQYVARVPPSEDGRRRRPLAQPEWTPRLAYAIGLIATDGGITRGRNLGFPSADRELVRHLLACLGKDNKISRIRGRTGGTYYRTQIGDAAFCRWLMSIGIEERKSLTIGALDVPDKYLFTVARGLLDGDGSIINKTTRADVGRRDDYYWEYLQTKFVCGSRPHLEWLRGRLKQSVGVDGLINHSCGTREQARVLHTALRQDREPSIAAAHLPRHIRATALPQVAYMGPLREATSRSGP